jgi:hypothetical protein
MFSKLMRAIVFGVLGIAIGDTIVYFAVSRWTSLDSMWINSGAVWPLIGLWAGYAMAESELGAARATLRRLLTLAAIPLCAAGNFLAFVITSRTWFAEQIAPEHRDLFYQLMHPDVLPGIYHRSAHGSSSLAWTWIGYLVMGLVVGPLVFWNTSKPTQSA